jgi:Carboxypeptidase regulatory-like domain/TonB-dependent Receptor Plug Domain
MMHRVSNAFGRFLSAVALAAVAITIATRVATAQQTSGKIEGTVTDQQNVPIANAQIFIVGTSFGAVTDAKGYYFINNVPVGTYTLRAQFIGYAPNEVRDARVQGGQTMTFSFKMVSSAVQVTGITVTAAANPIVPRDQVTSKSTIDQKTTNNLPVDDVRNVVTLQAGVIESGSGAGVSIRGGRPGEANVYIDGAPVRNQNSGAQGATVGTNAVEEASVTTGAIGVDFGDAQSGIIAFTTRSGGQKLQGSLHYSTDEPFGNSMSIGYNRFEGSVGGPVPGVSGLRFFASGVAWGRVAPERGTGWDTIPTYAMGGIDTVMSVNTSTGTNQVVIPRFVQASGGCDASQNYGFDCQGRRFPLNWRTIVQTSAKLTYSYGSGSSAFITFSANGDQGRNWPGTRIGDPQLYTGFHSWSRYVTGNLSHQFFKSAERALALNAVLSYQVDRGITGPLDAASEISTRSPAMGIDFSTLSFSGFGSFPFPITDQIIRNIRTNTGQRTPLLNRTDLRNSQPYRINPYGMLGGGWVTSGFDQGGSLASEKRLYGRANVDWQANRFHRLNFGGEVQKIDEAFWSSSMITQIFMDAYVVSPVRYAGWASDRLDLGDVVLELGGRYDYFDPRSLFSKTPGRIFTNPAATPFLPTAPTNDAAYQSMLNAVFDKSVGHHTLSPTVRVSFPITEKTDFRLSYSHQVQTPDLLTVLSGTNNDLSFTNTNDAFGRDIGFSKSIQFEFGVRHAFNPDLVLDVAAFNKDKVSDKAYRIKPFDDPANPGRTQNVNVLTTADFGYVRGVELTLERRIGSWLNAHAVYTFEIARNTGSDPFSYLRTSSRQISQVTGDRVPPPEQPLPQDDERNHNIVGNVSITVPSDWQKNSTIGRVLRDVSVFLDFRAFSGLPYTRTRNDGTGATAPRTNFGLISTALEPINSSHMPWQKVVDMRVNKGFKVGRLDVTAFADGRNIFNFKNIVALFTETGDVVNSAYRQNLLSPEFANLANEARQNGALLGNGDIDVSSCATWTASNAASVNCVMLARTEARFRIGQPDGVYSVAEQTRALNAYYDLFSGAQNFYGPPRTIRVGVELNF